ncbi:hypothetical protein ABFS82_09G091100 [Erythranthe guttata]|uniref:uncharacterized protein LOC105975583 n=1 Tax=Erythranthe guttata TaxID=4155 RepID=UPI00064DB298|nr:PREDICTED: uncharacterized protein LOC105975583 [Erythranthe guttata]|eukprot:XP_012856236.1 PREDICTED: uncharacterized protein LOC105975583 [Erythranthe guttata]
MKRAPSQSMLRHFQEVDEDDDGDDVAEDDEEFGEVDSISEQAARMTIHDKRQVKKLHEHSFSAEKHGTWKQEQRIIASKLKKQLKARWEIQKLIEHHLSLFRSHHTQPTKMSDVANILKPKWAPPHELAALYWFGDWRPSTILHLLHSLSHSLWDPLGVDRALCQLINDIRIEEAVIDEEMAEIQSNCVLQLPFGPVKNGPHLDRVRSEFKKIHRVVVKAQNLRMKALELALKKVLSQTDAAKFLVAFVGIQDLIHDCSVKYKTRKGPVCIKEFRG